MPITPQQFAHRARSFAADLPSLERRTVNAAALMFKNTATAELRKAVGGDLRMSGVGKRGAKVGARYDQGLSASTALVRLTGPVHLVETNMPAHRIPRTRRRGPRRRVLVIPGVGVRAWANHPGTTGKRPWAKTLNQAAPKVPKVLAAETSKALRGTFGG